MPYKLPVFEFVCTTVIVEIERAFKNALHCVSACLCQLN